jgi:phosphoglycerate dehydrogenase-like enzyme
VRCKLGAMNILWRSNASAEALETYKHFFSLDMTLKVETDPKKALEHRDWFNVLVDGNAPAALLDAPHLEHVIIPFVGLDPEFRNKLLERPALKVYNSHYNSAFVAQHALALLLACANRLVEADQPLRRGDWQMRYDGLQSMFLSGKTCLLLGYGAIGKSLAPLLLGLDMKVSALKRKTASDTAQGETIKFYKPDQLYSALSHSNIVICSLPETPETHLLLNQQAFAAMKPGSILINVGRGSVIDQHALYDALKSKHLLAAGIDVWWNYPKDKPSRANTLPSDAPLHQLANIVMSPHRANQFANEDEVRLKDVAETLKAIANGSERSRVDVGQGY